MVAGYCANSTECFDHIYFRKNVVEKKNKKLQFEGWILKSSGTK